MTAPTSKITRQMKLAGKRFCYYLPASQSEQTGFSPGVVVENESGYYQTDYNWGDVRVYAEEACTQLNRTLGLSEEDVTRIITSSMAAGNRDRFKARRRTVQ